jgi:hypothetical protein
LLQVVAAVLIKVAAVAVQGVLFILLQQQFCVAQH